MKTVLLHVESEASEKVVFFFLVMLTPWNKFTHVTRSPLCSCHALGGAAVSVYHSALSPTSVLDVLYSCRQSYISEPQPSFAGVWAVTGHLFNGKSKML